MPVEIEVHTVPHFKAPVNAKVELLRIACGDTFTVQTSLLKIGCLVHKLGVATEVVGTAILFFLQQDDSVMMNLEFGDNSMCQFINYCS